MLCVGFVVTEVRVAVIVRVQSAELSSVQRFVLRLIGDWGAGCERVGGVALLGCPLPRPRRRSSTVVDLLVWTPYGCTLVVLADFGSVQHGVLETPADSRWQVGEGAADVRTGSGTVNPLLRARRQRAELAGIFHRHGVPEHIDVLVVLIPKTGSRITWARPPQEVSEEMIMVRIGRSADFTAYFERPSGRGQSWDAAAIARAFTALGVPLSAPEPAEAEAEGFAVAGYDSAIGTPGPADSAADRLRISNIPLFGSTRRRPAQPDTGFGSPGRNISGPTGWRVRGDAELGPADSYEESVGQEAVGRMPSADAEAVFRHADTVVDLPGGLPRVASAEHQGDSDAALGSDGSGTINAGELDEEAGVGPKRLPVESVDTERAAGEMDNAAETETGDRGYGSRPAAVLPGSLRAAREFADDFRGPAGGPQRSAGDLSGAVEESRGPASGSPGSARESWGRAGGLPGAVEGSRGLAGGSSAPVEESRGGGAESRGLPGDLPGAVGESREPVGQVPEDAGASSGFGTVGTPSWRPGRVVQGRDGHERSLRTVAPPADDAANPDLAAAASMDGGVRPAVEKSGNAGEVSFSEGAAGRASEQQEVGTAERGADRSRRIPAGVRRGVAGVRRAPARIRDRVTVARAPGNRRKTERARPATRRPTPEPGWPAETAGGPENGTGGRRRGARYALVAGAAGVVLAALAGTVFAASGSARFDLAEYGALCQGGEGSTVAAPYSAAGPRPVYLAGELSEITAFGPSPVWHPADARSVQLVACVSEVRLGTLVQTCQYQPAPGRPVGRTLNLFSKVYRLSVYEARTGARLAAVELTGEQFAADPAVTEPDACRAAAGAPEEGLPGRRHSRLSQQQIQDALTPLVAPAASGIRAAR